MTKFLLSESDTQGNFKNKAISPTQLRTSETDLFYLKHSQQEILKYFLPVIKLMTKGNPVLFD